MKPEEARSWIKDGPMKEFARAQRGAGRYAKFGREPGTTAMEVARHALGDGWMIVPGSEGDKPFHCLARREAEEEAYLTWGDAKSFRNLLWAALVAAVNGVKAHVVVMEPPVRTTPRNIVKLHQAYAARCQLYVHHMRERLGPRNRRED